MIHPCLSSTKNTPVSCIGVPLVCFFHLCPPSIVLRTVPPEPTAHPRLASRKYTLMSVTSVPVFWGAAFSCGSAAFMDGTLRGRRNKNRMVKNPSDLTRPTPAHRDAPLHNQGRKKRAGDARTSSVKSASRRAGLGG